MKKIIIVCGLVISTFYTFAQGEIKQSTEANQAIRTEEDQVIEVTHKFYNTLETFTKSKDLVIEPVTKFLDKNFLSTRYIISVDGKQTRSEVKLDAYRNQLVAYKSIRGFSSTYRIEKVNFVRSYESFATINYSVLITASINDEVVLKFRSLVTNYLRKAEDGEWKIVESNGLNIYKDQEVGICPVAIAQKGANTNLYGVTVVSPAGNNFKTDNIEFAFKVTNSKTIITCGDNGYLMENGSVQCVKSAGEVVSFKLGKAISNLEAINSILAQHLYSNKCLGFKTMDK